ncbi:Lrp/AsnC family transcriptional regulator [Alkalimonas sp.]|uniref:Lrp/AsnC family transcriptional regulator n=1 Tax=Alkalimonas sp. TaxID=1872453 RepID=UPI00263B3257|nr:Lrp/AsnC family transcriptional regulator [Alkalimonas sp.]MCC5825522.1 Lrp/AsnC family transcriptional regulator [Alkalimonas sp.]
MISSEDEQLLAILRTNGRASVSDLARALDVSRTTIQNRLQRLEQQGVIQGYTVELGSRFLSEQVSAHVSIKVRQKLTARTNLELKHMPQVAALYAISGEYDLIAIVQAQNTEQLSHILDDIGNLEGVERTNSSVILETKFKR